MIKVHIPETTIIKYPNSDGYLLQNWVIKCNDKINNGKIQNFVKTTKTNYPTGYSGATSLLPIGNSSLYIETSSNIYGNTVFFSVLNEQILLKLGIKHSIITDFQFYLMIH